MTQVLAVVPAKAEPVTLMLFGDSLMAGYGLVETDGFAATLQSKLHADGYDINILNASVSGDTSGAALARLDRLLAQRPDAVLVGLGGNDMLQALPPERLERNLQTIILGFKLQDTPILLLGMLASPQLGDRYVGAFNAVYPELSDRLDVPLYPFLLEGVALDANLNQADRIHPNAAGVKIMVERIAPAVRALIESVR